MNPLGSSAVRRKIEPDGGVPPPPSNKNMHNLGFFSTSSVHPSQPEDPVHETDIRIGSRDVVALRFVSILFIALGCTIFLLGAGIFVLEPSPRVYANLLITYMLCGAAYLILSFIGLVLLFPSKERDTTAEERPPTNLPV